MPRELPEIRRTLKRHKNRLRRTPRPVLGVSTFVMQTAMAILSLSNMFYDMADDWLMGPKRRGVKVPEEITRATTRTTLEEILLAANAAEIVSWGDCDRCRNQSALRCATDYVRKRRLYQVVAVANNTQGKPLLSSSLLTHYNKGNAESETRGALLLPRPFENNSRSAQRVWAFRWRKKHNVKAGKIQFGEPPSQAGKRLKVHLQEGQESRFFLNADSRKSVPTECRFPGPFFWLAYLVFNRRAEHQA